MNARTRIDIDDSKMLEGIFNSLVYCCPFHDIKEISCFYDSEKKQSEICGKCIKSHIMFFMYGMYMNPNLKDNDGLYMLDLD